MTLIEMVRHCKKRGHNFITVDHDGVSYSSKLKPIADLDKGLWLSCSECRVNFKRLGTIEPFSDWTKAIIDINELRGVS